MEREWNPDTLREAAEEIRSAVMPKSITPEMVGGTLSGIVDALGGVVETSEAVMRLLGDFDDGKGRIARALTAQGCPTEASEPMAQMAEKIMDLRLAVDGQPGIVDQTMGGVLPTYDLLNELRNHQRADYPYCCGVMFPRVEPTVELKMADAYLCSDGFFTEEQETVHELTDTDRDMSYVIYYFRDPVYSVPAYLKNIARIYALNGRPQWSLISAVDEIRSYSSDMGDYSSLTLSGVASGKHVILKGVKTYEQIYNSGSLGAAAYTIALPDLEEITTKSSSNQVYFQIRSQILEALLSKLRHTEICLFYGCTSLRRISLLSLESITGYGSVGEELALLTSAELPALRYVKAERGVIARCPLLTSLELPALETVSGGTVVSNCAALASLELPALETVSGGTVVSNCAALASLELPALETVSGGTVVSNCAALASLELPALETVSGGTVVSNCAALTSIDFWSLTKATTSSRFVNGWAVTGNKMVLRFPSLKELHGQQYFTIGSATEYGTLEVFVPEIMHWDGVVARNSNDKNLMIVHLGRQQEAYLWFYLDAGKLNMEVTIEPGFRSTLIFYNQSVILSEETMRTIIANLGDNTGYPTLALTLGAANIAKLTEEDIAIATEKNYTVS